MTIVSKEADTTIEARFVMSLNITCAKLTCSGGQLVKKNIAVSVLNPDNTKRQRLITQTPISRHTPDRRISQICADVKKCLVFCFALDE